MRKAISSARRPRAANTAPVSCSSFRPEVRTKQNRAGDVPRGFVFQNADAITLRPRPSCPSCRCLLERGTQDVAERGARVGRAVLRHGLLLLRDFARLDREA